MVARPLTPAELLDRADLAGHALVLMRHRGRAHILFFWLLKGRPQGWGWRYRLCLSRLAIVRLRELRADPRLGDWRDGGIYLPGLPICTHLVWNETAQAYETLRWNAVSLG